VFNLKAVSDSIVASDVTDGNLVTEKKKPEDGCKNNKVLRDGYKGSFKEGYNNKDPSREGYKGQGYNKGPYKGQGYNKYVPQEGQYDQEAPSTVVSGKISGKDVQEPVASDQGRVASSPQDGSHRHGPRDYVNDGYKKGYHKDGYNNRDPSREGYKGQGYNKVPYKGQGYNKEEGYSKDYSKPKPKPIAADSPVVRRTDENARAKILEILNVPATSYIIQEPLEEAQDEAVDDYSRPQGGAKPRNYNVPKRGKETNTYPRPLDVGNEDLGRGRQVRVVRDQYPPRSVKADRTQHAPEQDGADAEWNKGSFKPKNNSARAGNDQGAQDIPEPLDGRDTSYGDSSADPSEFPLSEHDGAASRYNGRQQFSGLHGGGRDNGNMRSVFGSVVKSHLAQENKPKVCALLYLYLVCPITDAYTEPMMFNIFATLDTSVYDDIHYYQDL